MGENRLEHVVFSFSGEQNNVITMTRKLDIFPFFNSVFKHHSWNVFVHVLVERLSNSS